MTRQDRFASDVNPGGSDFGVDHQRDNVTIMDGVVVLSLADNAHIPIQTLDSTLNEFVKLRVLRLHVDLLRPHEHNIHLDRVHPQLPDDRRQERVEELAVRRVRTVAVVGPC